MNKYRKYNWKELVDALREKGGWVKGSERELRMW